MKRLFLSLLALLAAAFSSQCLAQTFIDHIEAGAAGQGTVTITQDERLTGLVNGTTPLVQEKEEEKKDDFSVQIVKRKKVRGYRVQMYWGNAQRSDQQKAQRIGTQVTSVFPELQAYTTFESPHWRCRVGDFTTRQEAAKYLTKLRKISRDAMIVRSEIYIYQ